MYFHKVKVCILFTVLMYFKTERHQTNWNIFIPWWLLLSSLSSSFVCLFGIVFCLFIDVLVFFSNNNCNHWNAIKNLRIKKAFYMYKPRLTARCQYNQLTSSKEKNRIFLTTPSGSRPGLLFSPLGYTEPKPMGRQHEGILRTTILARIDCRVQNEIYWVRLARFLHFQL